MIEVPDPPSANVCHGCDQPLSWVYSPRSLSWVALVPAGAGVFTWHRCRGYGTPPSWRDTRPRPAGDVHTAAADARAVLAAALENRTERSTNATEDRG